MKKSSLLLFLLILTPSFVFAQVSSAPVVDLQAQIQDLLKQIQALQQQVTTLQRELGKEPEKVVPTGGTPPAEVPVSQPEPTPPELTRSLSRGSSGDDVRKLQEFLSKDKDIYPNGLITGFFGPLTESAVKKWQEKYKIEAVGIIGPKTNAKFQELGRGVVQGFIQQGAGASGVMPPGLLQAPGIQKQLATTTPTASATTTPSGVVTVTPTTPAIPTSIASCLASPAIVNYTTSNSGIASDYVRSIAVDRDGSVWFGHILGKMSRFDGTTWRVYDIPPYVNPASPTNRVPPNVHDIVIDPKGNKWVATNFGIGKFDGTNWTTYSTTYLPNNPFLSIISATSSFGGSEFLSIAFDKDGVGWFGSNMNGVWRFDGLSWKQYVYPPDKLIGSRVYDIAVDSQNNKWFATVEGVSKFDGVNWQNYATGNSGLKDNEVVAVEIDPYGYLWFGTHNGGVSKFDEKFWTAFNSVEAGPHWSSFNSSNSGLAGNRIVPQAIAVRTDGTAWFGTRYNGASSFDGVNWRALDTSSGLLSNVITGVAADARGNIWLATDDKGASLIKCEQAATTPVPAISAVPATPAAPTITPATPATPAVPTQTTTTSTATTTATATTTTTTTATTTSTDTTAPSVPTNLTATAISSTQINLSWWLSSDNVGVTGYKVFRNGVQIDSPLTPSKSDTNLSPATIYTYTVAAVDGAGNVSAQSSSVSATTLAVSDTTPPTASNLVVTNITSTSASLSWNTNELSDSRVEYSSVGNAGWFCVNMEGTSCTFVTLGTALVTSHSGTLSGLQPNTLYYFRAYSVDASGNVGGLKSQFTTSPAVPAPPIPTGLTASVGTNGYTVIFTWNDVSGETEYRLWRRPTAGGDWTLITVPSQGYGAPVSFTYQQHPTGSYEYYVASCYSDWTQNIDTCSGQSNVVSLNVTVVSPTAQCTTVTLSTNKSAYTQGEFVNWTASCNGYAVHLSTRLYKPDGVQVTYTSTTNYNGFPNPFGAGFSTSNLANGTYILRECINPQCTSGPQASATFTIGSISTLYPRAKNLAAISQSLNVIKEKLQKLQEALR